MNAVQHFRCISCGCGIRTRSAAGKVSCAACGGVAFSPTSPTDRGCPWSNECAGKSKKCFKSDVVKS